MAIKSGDSENCWMSENCTSFPMFNFMFPSVKENECVQLLSFLGKNIKCGLKFNSRDESTT